MESSNETSDKEAERLAKEARELNGLIARTVKEHHPDGVEALVQYFALIGMLGNVIDHMIYRNDENPQEVFEILDHDLKLAVMEAKQRREHAKALSQRN